MQPQDTDEYGLEVWSVPFAAEVFDVPTAVLLRALRSGRLGCLHVGGRLRIRPGEVEALLAAELGPLH